MRKKLLAGFVWLGLLGWGLTGCGSRPAIERESAPTAPTSSGVIVTVAPLPSLYPTHTRPAAANPTAEAEPATRPPSPTPVNLTEPVLTLVLAIPDFELARSLNGNLAGAVALEDNTTGQSVVLARRGRLLAEIRAALLEAAIDPLPAGGCGGCVQITYELPADGRAESGWLRDPILAASLEFLFTNSLGPHFPPDTVIGFYRSASGYTVAHTVAIKEDGSIVRWIAPDETLLETSPNPAVEGVILIEKVNELPLRFFENAYVTDCAGYPLEIILLRPAGVVKEIDVRCPELALPSTLVAFYEDLNGLTADILRDARNLPFPEQPLPLEGVIFYQRPDGASLTLLRDGAVSAEGPEGEPANTVLPAELVDPLIDDLTAAEVLPRGVTVVIDPQNEQNYTDLLLVRGELGVYEFPWRDRVGQGLLPAVVSLEDLLIDLVGPLREDLVTPTGTATIGPSTQVTETVTITPTQTVEGLVTPDSTSEP